MASVTKNGFLAAVSRDQAPQSIVLPPKKRQKESKKDNQESPDRPHRFAFDLSQDAQQAEQDVQEHSLAPTADIRATRDLAQIDLATNQRGISQVSGATAGLSTDHGHFGPMAAAVNAPSDSPDQPHTFSVSRDRAMATFAVAPGTSLSTGIIAGVPQIIVTGKTDNGVTLGAIVGSNGPTHLTGLTVSSMVGPATLASSAVVVGNLSSKGTILEIDEDKRVAKIESSIRRYAGIVLNISAGFAPYGLAVAARLGASAGRDVKYTRWIAYDAAKEAISKNGFVKNTLVAAGLGAQKSPSIAMALSDLQATKGHLPLGIGESLSYKTFGSVVGGMGAAVLGIFAGLGGVMSGEHDVTLHRKGEFIYNLNISSRLAIAGNISVELPLLVVAYKNWARGMAVTHVLQFDVSKAPALAALYDALDGKLPGHHAAKMAFWQRFPGSSAATLDKDKFSAWLANPGAKLDEIALLPTICGVKRIGEEISQLKPSISKGISITFLTYVLRDSLGRIEAQKTQELTQTLMVSGQTEVHRKEFNYQSQKNFLKFSAATMMASLTPEMVHTKKKIAGQIEQKKDMAWKIKAHLKMERNGRKAFAVGEQWLARSLGKTFPASILSSSADADKSGPNAVVFGHEKTLITEDVLNIISSSVVSGSYPYASLLQVLERDATIPPEEKEQQRNTIAEDFMSTVVGPQVMKQGDHIIGILQRNTQDTRPSQVIYQDEEVFALLKKSNKMTIRRSGSLAKMSPTDIGFAVKEASDIVEGAIRVLERMDASKITDLAEVDLEKLQNDKRQVNHFIKKAHDLVNVGGTEKDAEKVAKRLPKKIGKRLIEMQTPPTSRRSSLRNQTSGEDQTPSSSDSLLASSSTNLS